VTDISVVPSRRPAAPRGLLADRAYRELRDRLVTLRIAPGAPIDEDLIGRELKMGRTPVREAIKRLALENLVTVFPRRGTFASEINITDLAHISDVRAQLESHAAYRAAERITDAQREELAALLDELHASRGTDDAEAPPSGAADHPDDAPPSGAADHPDDAPPSGAADHPDDAPPSGAADHPDDAPPSGAADHPDDAPPSGAADSPEALMELDARVHRFIYRCAANPFLEETLGRYFNLSLRIWYLVIDRLQHLFARVHEHEDVLLAISAGDAERARDILAAHIATFEREIRAVL
jgi:DNA-binding GntR family transcriptional regulator